MISTFSKYSLLNKELMQLVGLEDKLSKYDRFITAVNHSERVTAVLNAVRGPAKHCLMLPEYQLTPPSNIPDAVLIECADGPEDEALLPYFQEYPFLQNERVCLDATGFLRPHLLYILAYFYQEGINNVDVIYTEPQRYVKGSATVFSGNIMEVRQVRGFEGVHDSASEDDMLLVGCGYDSDAMSAVAVDKMLAARKVQMFPFPPLRPHMYQENRLRTESCETAFGDVFEVLFAPGYDPFVTAQVLSETLKKYSYRVKNVYLSPLATKAQVLGFGIYYLSECLGGSISIVLPFSDTYNQETSVGISEIWRYEIDFRILRTISHSDMVPNDA